MVIKKDIKTLKKEKKTLYKAQKKVGQYNLENNLIIKLKQLWKEHKI